MRRELAHRRRAAVPPIVLLRLGHAVRVRPAPLLMAGAIAFGAAVLIGRIESGWWHTYDGSLVHSAERARSTANSRIATSRSSTQAFSTFLNAGVFAVFGEDIFNLRIPLFVLFLALRLGCFFAIARRLVSSISASSWPRWQLLRGRRGCTRCRRLSGYLLFLTTFGMYSVIRYFETRRSRRLFVAGLAGGFGVAIKIVGILLRHWRDAGFCSSSRSSPIRDGSSRGAHAGTGLIAATTIALGLATYVLSSQLTAGNVASLLVFP